MEFVEHSAATPCGPPIISSNVPQAASSVPSSFHPVFGFFLTRFPTTRFETPVRFLSTIIDDGGRKKSKQFVEIW